MESPLVAMSSGSGDSIMIVRYVNGFCPDEKLSLTCHQLRRSRVYDWDNHAATFVSFIRFMIRAAIVESPLTTPSRGDKKESTLAAYESKAECGFDFAALPGEIGFEEVDDPPDMVY